MSKTEPPEYDEVADSLFETITALKDMRARLAGGATRSGVSKAQVAESTFDAYDIDGAEDILAQTGYERPDVPSPESWAFSERVETETETE